MLIVVAAGEHPELDDWVREQARAEATKSGVELGEYLEPAGLCCHVWRVAEP
jgi:hypothetical protein